MPRKSLIIPICALTLFLSGCNSQDLPKAKELPVIPVIAATPEVKDITMHLETIGILQAYVFLEVQPKTSGTIETIIVSEGQAVKKGDFLFRINPEIHEIKVEEAQAQLAMDQAGMKAVQKKMNRYRSLSQRDLVTKTEWDELKAELKKSRASVAMDEARLRQAKLELDYCTMTAPVDGTIGKIDTSEHLIISGGQTTPLTTISQIDPLIVEFTVTEKEFASLPKKEIPIEIQPLCSSGNSATVEGTVTFIDDHFDPKTGLLLMKGQVDNPNHDLRPGQSVRVKIPIDVTPMAKLIPQKAIRYNQQGPYVFVINEDSTVAIRQLVLGKEHGLDQIVLEGLDRDESIILEGHLRLSPGFKVEIKS